MIRCVFCLIIIYYYNLYNKRIRFQKVIIRIQKYSIKEKVLKTIYVANFSVNINIHFSVLMNSLVHF